MANPELSSLINETIGDKWIKASYQLIKLKKYAEDSTSQEKIYQIFVDIFYNGNENHSISNLKENSFIYGSWYDKLMYIKDSVTKEILRWDFYGGNLKGIIKKLNYLKKLGISCIYLNPIFESSSNHKYDTGDYKKIDSMFGNEYIFKELVKKAKQNGINVILDGVFNYTGSDSIYFNKENRYNSIGAYNSKESQYYKWYNFREYPDNYECWWGVKSLPSINEYNKYLNKKYNDIFFNLLNNNERIKYEGNFLKVDIKSLEGKLLTL